MATARSTAPPGFVAAKSKSKHSVSEDGTLSMVLFRPFGSDIPLGEFKQRLEMISSDLHRLLQLDTQDFWSMISFDRSVMRSIDSFLRFSPRHWFEIDRLPDDAETQQLLQTTSRLVFLVLLRLATNKDTTSRSGSGKQQREIFLPSTEFGQLIHDRRIWTIPMLFDTVALFGRKNGPVLAKMIESLFNCQPKFIDDLARAFSATEIALRQMASQLEELLLIKNHDSRSLLSQLSDMVIFSYDTFSTLETFVRLYQPSAVVVAQNCTTLTSYCAEFADSTLQTLTGQLLDLSGKVFCDRQDCSLMDAETLLRIAAATEVRIVGTFHTLLANSCLLPPENIHPEQFLSELATASGHLRFIWLLDTLYPIYSDIATLEQKSSREVDPSCKEYVISAVYEAKRAMNPDKSVSPEVVLGAVASGGGNEPLSEKEIDEMIRSVGNVMGSNFSQLFIAKCLARFDYNADALVQALLDDNLPPDLRDEQHEDERFQYTSENIQAALTSVHRGKRDTVLENDELKEMKPFFKQFANVVVTKVVVPPSQQQEEKQPHSDLPSKWVNVTVPEMEYQDEYDDTYDDNEGAVGPRGHGGDELLRRRAFTVPRVLSAGADKVVDESSEDEEEEEEEQESAELPQPQPQQQFRSQPYDSGRGRGGWQGRKGRGGGPIAASDGQETEHPLGPRSGDTRGFKGANRDRQKMEISANKQRPQSDYGRGGGAYRAGDRPPRQPANENQPRGEEEGRRQHGQQENIPEDVQRMRKERHNVNHHRRDLAERKRREF